MKRHLAIRCLLLVTGFKVFFPNREGYEFIYAVVRSTINVKQRLANVQRRVQSAFSFLVVPKEDPEVSKVLGYRE